ncbi:hypothetical protein ACFX2I_001145 [Malus domestica]|uniref:uncharacterized protein n=1 Tax=Malus domestica TaxID=3750 RepID=UPI0010A9AC14|nr:uncharacterized protein LOC103433610 isoform X1 [Malus domestica]XP_008370109.2 uncharacterized protein LOC103433610 isoform X1 [Malus domestica]XP_028956617.1 uncharacterized protein LOC103433610 isoform X1 [Malus domestica]
MPVSGNEETGVKPVTRKSSDYSAGVPIKKRRFFMRPPSPPPEEPILFPKEEPSSFPAKINSVHEESRGSTPSYVSITSSGLSDANKIPESDYGKGNSGVANVSVARGNDNIFRVKLEEPSLTIHSSSLDDMQGKGKLVLSDNPTPELTLRKSELTLAPNEALASNVGTEILQSQSKVEVKCKEEMPAVAESTELSLGLREHLAPALTGRVIGDDRSYRNQGNLEPMSLDLSLSKEKTSSQCDSSGKGLNSLGADMSACRANWDLNTPMDAWTDTVSDSSVFFYGSNATGGVNCTTGLVGAGVNKEKLSIVQTQNRGNEPVLSTLANQYKPNDSLLLRLSSSCSQLNQCQNPSSSSSKLDLHRVISATNVPRLFGPIRNLNLGNHKTVKSEPFDEGVKLDVNVSKLDVNVSKPSNTGLVDSSRAVKCGVVEQGNLGAVKSSNTSTRHSVDARPIKSEPTHVDPQETIKSIEGTSVQLDKHLIQGLDNRSCDMTLPMTSEVSCRVGKPCSTELTMSRDVIKHSGNVIAYAPMEACQSKDQVAVSQGPDTKGNNTRTEDGNVDSESCKLKFMNDQSLDSRGSGEGSASDEEKINISGDMLEDSYGSDCESDGAHALDTTMDTEQDGKRDDYEDGEVRESVELTAVEEPICMAREVEHDDNDDFDNKRTELVGPINNVQPTSFYYEAKDNKDNLAETSNNNYKESFQVVCNDKSDTCSDEDMSLHEEPLAVENLTIGAGVEGSTEPDDQAVKMDAQKCQDAEFSGQVISGNQGTVVESGQGKELHVNNTDLAPMGDSNLPKTSGSGDNAAKDTSYGGQRSRIITLPRSSTVSPSKSISISGQPLPSRVGREILTDVEMEEENIHSRGRGEPYVNRNPGFSRERYQDQSLRYPRLGSGRGRGRMHSRGNWGSDRNYASELYNNQTNYRVPRHKYAPNVSDADLEYNTYNMPPDSAFYGTGRGGRKLSNDGPLNYRIPSRRRSPVGVHTIYMPRRNPRNISPTRFNGEDAPNLVGMRHNEKFMRGFHDDSADPMFTRSQPSYEGVHGQFGRGNRNFSFAQRRGIPRVSSKSPIRSRTRSPGPWSSPRRRSPDGFGGPRELTHRRSPPVYRMERFRSPDDPCFPGEMVVRRNPSNDLRNMDPGRDHGPPRSVIPNGSPSSRSLVRNRRFDVMDPRERPNNGNYFGGAMHSSRLHELGGDGSGDERRRFAERRGPVRSFRPYNGVGGETFHLNGEDGPRPLRFCPDDNTEFQERGNLRERDFDRRIKNRPGNAPRRMRGIEDQEANCGHGEQPWHDGVFDDTSQVKRKRF